MLITNYNYLYARLNQIFKNEIFAYHPLSRSRVDNHLKKSLDPFRSTMFRLLHRTLDRGKFRRSRSSLKLEQNLLICKFCCKILNFI